jgi:hypothetical protein
MITISVDDIFDVESCQSTFLRAVRVEAIDHEPVGLNIIVRGILRGPELQNCTIFGGIVIHFFLSTFDFDHLCEEFSYSSPSYNHDIEGLIVTPLLTSSINGVITIVGRNG